jgi:hypothetical protein
MDAKKIELFNKGARERLRPRYAKNLEANLAQIPAPWPGIISQRGKHKNRAAILVGAGPSVADQKELLRLACVHPDIDVIAVNRAAAHIPHTHVFGITTYPEIKEHLTYPRMPLETLITSSTVFPGAIKAWIDNTPGNEKPQMLFFHMAAGEEVPELYGKNCEPRTGPIGRIDSAGMVSTQLIRFAMYCGYSYIVCVGYDFVLTGGWVDVSRTKRMEDMGLTPDKLFWIESLNAFTTQNLALAYLIFAEEIKETWKELNGKLINCTEHGTWEKQMELATFLEQCGIATGGDSSTG